MQYVTAMDLALRITKRLAPYTRQIAIAGSLRRMKPTVNDIEIVCEPLIDVVPGQLGMFESTADHAVTVNRLFEVLDAWRSDGTATVNHMGQRGAWGERNRRFFVSPNLVPIRTGEALEKIDLFIVTPPAEWGAIMVLRTGPADFGHALMLYLNYYTSLQHRNGALWDGNRKIATPDERAFFDAVGLPYWKPEQRSVAALRKHIRDNKLVRRV